MGILMLGNGMTLSTEIIDKCKEKVFLVIEKELPEEIQIHEAYLLILEQCKEELKYKRIIL